MLENLESIIKAKREAFSQRHEAILKEIAKAEKEKQTAETQLQELKESIPDSMARHALGEATKAELIKVRRQVHVREQIVYNSPLLLSGLQRLLHQNSALGYQFTFVEENFRKFKSLIAEMEEKGITSERQKRLRTLCREISNELSAEIDVQEILSSIKMPQGTTASETAVGGKNG